MTEQTRLVHPSAFAGIRIVLSMARLIAATSAGLDGPKHSPNAINVGMCQDPLDRFGYPILVHSLRPRRRTPPAQTSRPRPRRQGAAAAAETLDTATAAPWRAGGAGVGATMLGWGTLIPTAVGTTGGLGRPRTNRSGWTAYAPSNTVWRPATCRGAWPRCTTSGLSKPIPLWRCSVLYQATNSRIHARASSMLAKRSG
jgi:hypothetical protein